MALSRKIIDEPLGPMFRVLWASEIDPIHGFGRIVLHKTSGKFIHTLGNIGDAAIRLLSEP